MSINNELEREISSYEKKLTFKQRLKYISVVGFSLLTLSSSLFFEKNNHSPNVSLENKIQIEETEPIEETEVSINTQLVNNNVDSTEDNLLPQKEIISAKPYTLVSSKRLDVGLHLYEIIPHQRSTIGDSKITILKINPDNYEFGFYTTQEHDRIPIRLRTLSYSRCRTAEEWANEFDLVTVINAGMYEGDDSSTGYMVNFNEIITPNFKPGYNSVLAFNRNDSNVPRVKIIDLKTDNLNDLEGRYNSFLQSMRMIGNNHNYWSPSHRKWSIAALSTDKVGNLYLIHSRSPFSVHEFNEVIMNLPINIDRMMYLEGGPEASLYINSNGNIFRKIGSYETGFWENNNNRRFWPLPNVIGLRKRH
jgi:hypothetical protein